MRHERMEATKWVSTASGTLLGVFAQSFSTGCSSLPSRYVQQAERGVTLVSLAKSPVAYQGKTVVLGKQWARVTVVGWVMDAQEGASSIEPTTKPVLSLLFMRG